MAAPFKCALEEYDASTAFQKLGSLISDACAHGFATHYSKQIAAWEKEFSLVGEVTQELTANLPTSRRWWLLFEYEIPRRGKRPDVVLIADDLIFVIEFKIGAASFLGADVRQVRSYALDLRDFHLGSCGRCPMLTFAGNSGKGTSNGSKTTALPLAPDRLAERR